VEIQESIASGRSFLKLRIGANLGEVIVAADGDLFGDGINIAVRLEGVAEPGGILISEKVYSEVEGKLDVGLEDRGEQQLKNISKPVRAYAVCVGAHSAPTERLSAAPPLSKIYRRAQEHQLARPQARLHDKDQRPQLLHHRRMAGHGTLANARPNMIATLDSFRDTLEDLGGGLGVTDPVSGPLVLTLK
jgi:Adenylate and Guanylate cyclase catalytic domain